MLNRTMLLLGAVAATALVVNGVQAATITGNVTSLQPFTTYNLDTGTSDWAIYGRMDYSGGSASDFTHKTSSSSFSTLSILGNGPYLGAAGGTFKFSHGLAYGTYPAATTGLGTEDDAPAAAESNTLARLSFTHTVLAPSETLQIFVTTKAHAQQWVDVSATIDDQGYTAANVLLPLTGNSDVDNNPDWLGRFGIINLSVSGATIGDELKFSLSTNYTNNTNVAGWWGVGIAGATVSAVPEPASLGLLAGGSVLLLNRRRQRA